MSLTEYAFVAFFIAIALFSIVDAIRTPLLVKRLYKEKGFSDKGKGELKALSDSMLLEAMYTERLNTGTVQGVEVSQCKAWSVNRRQFTLSKATRNRNRTAWSITTIKSNKPHPTFLALPTIVPEAVAYIGDGRSIDFPDDDDIQSRYHITTENPDQIRSVCTGDIRQFLLETEVIFLHQTEHELVLKRRWSADKVTNRLERELNFAVQVHERLGQLS